MAAFAAAVAGVAGFVAVAAMPAVVIGAAEVPGPAPAAGDTALGAAVHQEPACGRVEAAIGTVTGKAIGAAATMAPAGAASPPVLPRAQSSALRPEQPTHTRHIPTPTTRLIPPTIAPTRIIRIVAYINGERVAVV